jgi:hypothetical protein
MILFSSWIDFYSDTTLNIENQNNTRIIYSSGIYHLSHLLFIVINSSLAGDPLSFTSGTNNQILIEETLFSQCRTIGSYEGGAIYFNNYGDCQFSLVCGSSCNTGGSKHGQFYQCIIPTTQKSNFTIHLSSFFYYITRNSGYGCTILFYYGNHNIHFSNISNNYCGKYSRYIFSRVNISFTYYSTFENNYAIS